MLRWAISAFIPLLMSNCLGIPDGVEPVQNLDLKRYQGIWYEIARLDHSFERGLEQVTAEYLLRDDGSVKVINRGYSPEKKKWQEASGKARFADKEGSGHLKVSFFGPFYGSYVVFELDQEQYQYAFVTGASKSYLWLLARTPQVDEAVIKHFIQQSEELGYPIDELIFVNQVSD